MKKKLLALCILIIVIYQGLSAQGSTDKTTFKEKFRDAEYFFLRGNFRESAFLYHELLKADPSNSNLQFLTGASYLSVDGMKEKAIPFLEKAVASVSPGYREGNYKERNAPREAFFALGRAYHIENNFDEARKYYAKYKNVMPLQNTAEIKYVGAQIASVELAKQMIRDTLGLTLTDAGERVNASISTSRAVLAEKDSILVYMSVKPFYSAIMMTKKMKGKWATPENINEQLKADDDCEISGISRDGSELYLVRQGEVDKDLYVSRFKKGRWTPMKKLDSPVNSPYDESHASVSADMKTLCFTSNRPGGNGAMDIYFSTRLSGGQWSDPVNAGKVVNSLYSEDTPFLSDDGQTLYFSSMGHATMGGYDIFYSSKLPDNTWSVPANIGFPVSTSDDDLFFFPLQNGEQALYSSSHQPWPENRIEWIRFNRAGNEQTFTLNGNISTNDNGIIDSTVTVKIVNTNSGDTITVVKPDPLTGKYTADIPSGDFRIDVTAENYKKEEIDLKLKTNAGQENIHIENSLQPESVANGEFLLVKNILFGFDKYEIYLEDSLQLEKFYQIMTKYPDLFLQVRGHTDSRGSSAYNLELSRKRARAVIDYLVSKGVSRERFISTAVGEDKNIAINVNPDGSDNPEGRRLNRQVEISLINNHYSNVRIQELDVPENLRPARDKHYYIILEQLPGKLKTSPSEVRRQMIRLFETDHGVLYTAGPFDIKTSATAYLNSVIDENYPEAILLEEQNFKRLLESTNFDPGELRGPFTIQLLALKKEIDFSIFKHPENIQLFEGKDEYHRYVTGIFETYDEAKKRMDNYFNQGYTDAFVMPISSYTITPQTLKADRDPDFYFTIQITATKNKPDQMVYNALPKVRITRESDGFYRVSQGIYLRKAEAEKALEKIRNKGFPDAFIHKIGKEEQ
ncbi:MAG TPA: OmpA family protein [Bacteroidales bacterium]|nr:OmpA family protein [Bacteroidales bacterium]